MTRTPREPKRSDSHLLTGRAGRIWQEYMRGASQAELARRHHVSQQRISQIIDGVRQEITAESIEEVNSRTIGLLQELTAVQMRIVDEGPQPKTAQNGKVIVNPATGDPIPDWSQVSQATGMLLRISERHAKILGSDAPAKADVSVSTASHEAAKAAAASALQFLNGDEEDSGGDEAGG